VEALFPTPPPTVELPSGYAKVLGELKQRIEQTRLATVIAANTGMIRLYWHVGRVILSRQEREGWGAEVIDDLRQAFPDMGGLSARSLKYMRAFASAWTDREIVQAPLAQLTWYHHSIHSCCARWRRRWEGQRDRSRDPDLRWA
jgi:predicted nuclease of restriction endonuclease-like (RecB) superfamily